MEKDKKKKEVDEFQVIHINPPRYSYDELKEYEFHFADDTIVLLWSSNQFLPSAFLLLDLWELQYRTMLTWVKTKRTKNKSKWLLEQTEQCLLATKGEPHINLTDWSTVMIAASLGRNQKPEEFYFFMSDLCDGKRIDIFSSEKESPPNKERGN